MEARSRSRAFSFSECMSCSRDQCSTEPFLFLGGPRQETPHNVGRLRDGRLARPPDFVANLTVVTNPNPVAMLVTLELNEIHHVPILGTRRTCGAPTNHPFFQDASPVILATTRVVECNFP